MSHPSQNVWADLIHLCTLQVPSTLQYMSHPVPKHRAAVPFDSMTNLVPTIPHRDQEPTLCLTIKRWITGKLLNIVSYTTAVFYGPVLPLLGKLPMSTLSWQG